MKATRLFVALVLAVGLSTLSANADLSSTFSQGNLAAKVTFAQDGTNLLVTLQNTATAGASVPKDALTGVYFSLPGVTLTPVRVVLASGSKVVHPDWGSGVDSHGEIGGEYAYRSGISGVPSGADMVLASSGMGIVGPHDRFPGWNLSGQNAPGGLNYGIISGIADDANRKVKKTPLVKDSVIFTLAGLPSDFDLAGNLDLDGVRFNYGTAFNPVGDFSVPAPGAAVLGLIGLAMVGMWRRNHT